MFPYKNPFNNQLFNKIYVCAFSEPKSGYQLSKEIYGYQNKGNYILKIIKRHPKYFKTIHDKNNPYPKYQSKTQPLLDYISNKIDINQSNKNALKKIIDSIEFKSFVQFNMGYHHIQDIINVLGTIFGSTMVVMLYFQHKINDIKKAKITQNELMDIAKITEKKYKNKFTLNIPSDKLTELYSYGSELSQIIQTMSPDFIMKIGRLSPITRILVETTYSTLLINDEINKIIINKIKKLI
jgi:hypothetical protein